MQKKVLALFALLALLIGIFAVGASANTTTERYEVGYAIEDINPWADIDKKVYNASDPSACLVPVPLSGYANSAERLATAMVDDNGDGTIDNNDGLHVTCTAVTDAWDTTILYFTVDAISGFGDVTADLRSKMEDELGIQADHIMFSGSHSHSAADLESCREAGEGTSLRKYYDYALSQMVKAGKEAYNSRTEAVMTKGEINATESSGYQLNFVRHYNVIEQEKYFGHVQSEDKYVAGSNFGGKKEPENTSELFTSFTRTVEPVSEANDTMYLLQFAPTNGDNPIVLVNWRAHATLSSNSTTDPVVSADYINALRYQLQKENYRAAFIQSAAGNINPRHAATDTSYTPWLSASVPTSELPNPTEANLYGYLLSQVALDCLNNNMTNELEPGRIHTIQTSFKAYAQADSEGLRAAADHWYESGSPNSFPYEYNDYILNSVYHANKVRERKNYVDGVTTKSFELNAIAMGPSVAMVTSPCEMFDRYAEEATLENINEYNDWTNLEDINTYGTPWLLGYTNNHSGYIPNKLAYTYNEGHSTYGVGSYEANTSGVAAGEGEEFLVEYARLLDVVTAGYKTGPCKHCNQENVEWQPLTVEDLTKDDYTLAGGHYYLYEDIPLPSDTKTNRGEITDATVCLDLNGKTLRTRGKAFRVRSNGTLTIMDSDSEKKGCIESCTALWSEVGGVVTTVNNENATINLYGGTLKFAGENAHTTKGGIIAIYPTNTFNMYGGVLDASACTLVQDASDLNGGTDTATDGCGAAIAVYPGATINISGGRVIAGTAEPEAGRADCILVQDKTSKVTLSGDAQIDEIYFDALCPENFKISGAYTGTATLQFNQANIALEDRMDIGNNENADLSEAELTFGTDSNYYVVVSDADLLLTNASAAVCGSDGIFQYYDSLGKAVSAYSVSAKYIQLCRDVPVDVTIDKNIYLDLNGYDITGKLSVNEGCILYCMDSQTDDYTIEDKYGYGKLTNVSGTIKGVPEESAVADDGYLKITENGAVSFHRVNLDLTHMTLRPVQSDGEPSPGVYYKSNFMGDEKVADAITQYGVALSVQEMPNEKNLETKSKYSSYLNGGKTIFKPGQVGNSGNGTLLKGIMKPNNAYLINLRNSHIDIYGRAYILTEEGYMFGGGHKRTLKKQTEDTDTLWTSCDDDKKQALSTMYNTYKNIMYSWNIPNISGKYDIDADGTLRILGIGNSYTMDCMWMLGKVYAAENPGKKIQLGIAYYSGASLAQHVDFITNKNNVYTYYYLDDVDGTWKDEQNVTLEYIIGAKKWDMVSMQQGSTDAPTQATYNGDIQTIQNHVIDTLNYKPLFFWNMTWAYPVCKERPNYTLDDQMNIYYSIVNAVKKKIIPDETFEFVMPVGVAVQNANTVLDDADLYFDTTHINAYSRIMAAYTWYCQLENVNANLLTELKVTTTPEAFNKLHGNGQQVNHSDEYMLIALEAVRNALITGRVGTFALTDLTSAQ